MDEYRIDSHKLMYHVGRVNDWLSGADIAPIYIEISPAGHCNHRCTYCALDFMGYRPRLLDAEVLKARLKELSLSGVKSVMYAGEGEPLLHKGLSGIIRDTKYCGVDVALTTNGVLMNEGFVASTLEHLSWIKVSINAGTKETYASVHGTGEDDFERVLANIRAAVRYKRDRGLNAAIGMQMILLPENACEAATLAGIARDAGADYLVIKSYSQHNSSITRRYEGLDYGRYLHLNDELKRFNSGGFSVVFRVNAMGRLAEERKPYNKCLALPFWAYIDSGGGLWACSAWLGDERFYLGDLNASTFNGLWTGERRRAFKEFAASGLDIDGCRKNCRMDAVNRYLWELKNPGAHVNFI